MLSLSAAAMGDEGNLYCAMSGLDSVHPERWMAMEMEGMPSADQFFKDNLAQGAKIYACGPSREMLEEMGITEEILDEGVEIEDVTGFLLNIKPVTQDTVLTFI